MLKKESSFIAVACNSIKESNKSNSFDVNYNEQKILLFKQPKAFCLLKRYKQKKLIKQLKLKAKHLLLTTKIEEFKKVGFLELFFIFISNLLNKEKIEIKNSGGGRFLRYNSYKISINRLGILLLNAVNIEKRINFTRNTEKDEVKSNSYFFSVPSEEFKLEKTVCFNEKDYCLNIIPWFNWVYFEYTFTTYKENHLEYIISKINNEFAEQKLGMQNIKSGQNLIKVNPYTALYDLFCVSKQNIPNLKGSQFDVQYDSIKLMEYCDEKYDEAKHILNNPQYFKKLFYKYGAEIEKLTYQAYEFWNQFKDIKKTWLMAEIWYAYKFESCSSADDFIYLHSDTWMEDEESKETVKLYFNKIKESS